MFIPHTLDGMMFRYDEQMYQVFVDEEESISIQHLLTQDMIDDPDFIHTLLLHIAMLTEQK